MTKIGKVPVATSPLSARARQVTVSTTIGTVDPEGGVQVPGVAPGSDCGVGQVTTAPAKLVAKTSRPSAGTRRVPVRVAPVRVAPVRSAQVRLARIRLAP